ncbi:MAG: hypothetical protein ACI9GW_000401, partial [Halieaceae bacterium]
NWCFSLNLLPSGNNSDGFTRLSINDTLSLSQFG